MTTITEQTTGARLLADQRCRREAHVIYSLAHRIMQQIAVTEITATAAGSWTKAGTLTAIREQLVDALARTLDQYQADPEQARDIIRREHGL